MLRKWFANRKVAVIDKVQDDDVDLVFNTQSDFDDVNMSRVDALDMKDDVDEELDLSEYSEPVEGVHQDNQHEEPLAVTPLASLENKPVSALGPILATVLSLGLYVALLYLPKYDGALMMIHGHFNIVSFVSLLAAAIALVVGLAGAKLRNIQVNLVSMAFVSLGIVFGVHGLATPGFILQENAVVAMAAPLSMVLTLFWLYLSSLPSDNPVIRQLAKGHVYLIPVWTGILIALSALLIYQPGLADLLPLQSNPLRFIVGFVALELAVLTAWHYWQSYRYTRSPLQIAIVYSATLLAVATIIMSTGTLWHTSWWLYHGLLLFAVGAMLAGLVRQYNRGRSLALAFVGNRHRNPVERLEAAISPGVRHLIEVTEQHDAYTAGHNHRVAVVAVQIGQHMGLSPEKLRALAQGGIVHDLGKLNIPGEILNKPGKLEADERALIETHPMQGYNLAKRWGFMPEELDIIRYHHERWDGTGYPDKLAAEHIPLLARITSIADVYDALTSERAYRKPWSYEQARTYILGQAGFQFDPQCVEAWDQMNQAQVEETEDVRELLTATIGATA
jgi:HD-GYP domain-containing protein (c-di-GMP phosphodiesterase class II)